MALVVTRVTSTHFQAHFC